MICSGRGYGVTYGVTAAVSSCGVAGPAPIIKGSNGEGSDMSAEASSCASEYKWTLSEKFLFT